jgi:hypothetical protein
MRGHEEEAAVDEEAPEDDAPAHPPPPPAPSAEDVATKGTAAVTALAHAQAAPAATQRAAYKVARKAALAAALAAADAAVLPPRSAEAVASARKAAGIDEQKRWLLLRQRMCWRERLAALEDEAAPLAPENLTKAELWRALELKGLKLRSRSDPQAPFKFTAQTPQPELVRLLVEASEGDAPAREAAPAVDDDNDDWAEDLRVRMLAVPLDADDDAEDGSDDDDNDDWAEDMRVRMLTVPLDKFFTRFFTEAQHQLFVEVYDGLDVALRTPSTILNRLVLRGVQGLTYLDVERKLRRYEVSARTMARVVAAAVASVPEPRTDAALEEAAQTARKRLTQEWAVTHLERERVSEGKAMFVKALADERKRRFESESEEEIGPREEELVRQIASVYPQAKKAKAEAAAGDWFDARVTADPELAVVWTRERSEEVALRAYKTTPIEEFGGLTAQEALLSLLYSMYTGKHCGANVRGEAFNNLCREAGKVYKRWMSRPAFLYQDGDEHRWGDNAAEANKGQVTRKHMTMIEAETLGFKHVVLCEFPCSLNALWGEYAVQQQQMRDLEKSGFASYPRGYSFPDALSSHFPVAFFRRPVGVDVDGELEKMDRDGQKVAFVYITYMKVDAGMTKTWLEGDRSNTITTPTGTVLDINY